MIKKILQNFVYSLFCVCIFFSSQSLFSPILRTSSVWFSADWCHHRLKMNFNLRTKTIIMLIDSSEQIHWNLCSTVFSLRISRSLGFGIVLSSSFSHHTSTASRLPEIFYFIQSSWSSSSFEASMHLKSNPNGNLFREIFLVNFSYYSEILISQNWATKPKKRSKNKNKHWNTETKRKIKWI